MSRHGYIYDIYDQEMQWANIRWRGAVKSALRGKRGQAFLRKLAEALDAMPEKRLIGNSFQTETGEVCALGAYYKHHGLQPPKLDDDYPGYIDHDWLSGVLSMDLDIAEAMAREIMFENDEGSYYDSTPEQRWQRMREWVRGQLDGKPADDQGRRS